MEPFGAWIRREREQRGIMLEAISLSTKIRIRFLEALEADRLDQLPDGIIGRGFVRAIANHIGIDQEEAVAAYLAARAPSPVEPVLKSQEPAIGRYIHLAIRPPTWVVGFAFLAFYCGLVALAELRQHYDSQRKSSAKPVLYVGAPLSPTNSNGVRVQSINAAGNSESTLGHITGNSIAENGEFSSSTARRCMNVDSR